MELLHDECIFVLKEAAKENGIEKFDLEIISGNEKGEVYLGDNLRIKLEDKKDPNNVMRFYMKIPANLDRNEIPLNKIYQREIFVYTELFKAFKELQEKTKLSPENLFTFVQNYTYSKTEGKEILLLEDLTANGFTRLPSSTKIQLDHIALMVTQLAKFHALSFVLRYKHPEQFKILVKKADNFTNNVDSFTSYTELSLEMAISNIFDRIHKEKLDNAKDRFLKSLKQAIPDSEYNVFLHANCYIDNAMFKLQQGDASEVRLVDYQFVYYGPPAVDLVYMLLSSTSGELRKEHYEGLLSHYRCIVSKVIDAHGLKPHELFPEVEFRRQLKEYGYLGMVSAVALCRPMSVAKYEAEQAGRQFDAKKMQRMAGEKLEEWKKRVGQIVDDCMMYEYI